jgi:hypothetical protein
MAGKQRNGGWWLRVGRGVETHVCGGEQLSTLTGHGVWTKLESGRSRAHDLLTIPLALLFFCDSLSYSQHAPTIVLFACQV